jgi:two-component system response regulator HupR/HoxA
MDALCAYHWPGNVRELQNELQRYLVEQHLEFIGNEFVEQDNVPEPKVEQEGLSFRESVEAYEKHLIAKTLVQNNWHQAKAAKSLDISVRTLYNKMVKYGLKNDR